MKGLRSIPRILKINKHEEYRVSLLFNNGESRVVDFEKLFKEVFRLKPGMLGYQLLGNIEEFRGISIMGTTVGWENIGIESLDEDGNKVFYPYELDPLVLYENSEDDPSSGPFIGMKIREARKAAGMTQEELARRSGTTKYYISKLENDKSDIELLTLRKIVEAGLGKELQIQIK
jgi:DNA-binding XRE family transcriptional regulator